MIPFHLKAIMAVDWETVTLDNFIKQLQTPYFLGSVITALFVCLIVGFLYYYYKIDNIKQLEHRQKLALLRQYKQEQQELKEFLGSAYHDYNLVIALDNGNPVESRIVRDRFQMLCEQNNFEVVVFHSLRHLSTGYKLKMTNGDIKSVQGDTGHAEAEMVMDVYSRIIDEDRRLNAKKLDEQFYNSLDTPEEEPVQNSSSDKDNFFNNLMEFISNDSNRQRLQEMLNLANN